MQEITIEINEHGDVQVEGHHFRGDECVKLTADLEDALGEVTSRKLKPDYRLTQAVLRKAGR